ncbi:TPA: hypothetical protein SUB30_004767 [Bacillus pseudomycoides]|nr:hypothetical protein [Bacillus pseudomycoides]
MILNRWLTEEEYEMAIKNGISRRLVYVRVYQLGWSVEEAITVRKGSKHHVKKRKYGNWPDIAEENGIPKQRFYERVRQHGWSVEEAATVLIGKKKQKEINGEMKGKELPTEDDYLLAKQNGIGRKNVYQRVVTYGMSIDKAITKPLGGRGPGKHRGMAQVASQNGISQPLFSYRRSKGYSLYDAATIPVKEQRDHGYYAKLAEENGVPYNTYIKRLSLGWDKEKAATKPPRKYKKKQIS